MAKNTVHTIDTYLKQAIVRQRNAEQLRKSKTIPAGQVEQAQRDAQTYALIAHTMALENDRVVKEGGKAVYR